MKCSEWRKEKLMLTRTELAELLGVSTALISMIESNKAPISTKLRRKISIQFSVQEARELVNG